MARHEIRSRCRRPKNISYSSFVKKYARSDRDAGHSSSETVLNLKVSPSAVDTAATTSAVSAGQP